MIRPVQDTIDAYWSQRAPSYDDYQQRAERRELDTEIWSRIWSSALPPAPSDVLDVGTGSGHVACLLARLGHRTTGIDLAPAMLDRAREHAAALESPPRILSGDAVRPDFPAGSFDAITGRYVMWTLREPLVAVASWILLLRPGGVVAMADSTWFPQGLGDLYDDAARRALPVAEATSIDRTAEVLREGGLVDVEVTPLHEVLELDRRLGVAPGHEVQLQYLVTGRRP
ncbi:methyltransferase domain-containing protein [Nocardioides lijunqiniae]|uniref:methyltransferase domain-containing protein n=1 Tax=Nocardioides lijunqiniae TaxID=2760832 RepID=UPI001877D12D